MHAFVDESGRNGLTICVVKLESADADLARAKVRSLLKHGQERLHMTKESSSRQRLILARLCELPIKADIYRSAFRVQRDGRAEIMRRIAADTTIDRLTIESAAGQDSHDTRVLQQCAHRLGRRSEFSYEHRAPRHEPLLWSADAIVFAYAAGRELRRRCQPLIARVETLAPPYA